MNKEDAYNSTYKYNMLFNTIPENNEADDDAKFNTNLISDIDLQNFDPKRHEYYTNLLNIYNNDPDTLKKLLNKYNSVKSFKEKEKEIIRKVNNYINIIQSGGEASGSGEAGYGIVGGGDDGELEKIGKDCDKMIKTTGDLLNESAGILLAAEDDKDKDRIKGVVDELIELSKISSVDLSSPGSPSSQSSSLASTQRTVLETPRRLGLGLGLGLGEPVRPELPIGRPGLPVPPGLPIGRPGLPGLPIGRPGLPRLPLGRQQQYDEKALVKAITDFTNISKKLLNPSVRASTPDSVIIAVETSKKIVELLQDKQIKSPEVSDALDSSIKTATKLKLADAETNVDKLGEEALSSAIDVADAVSKGLLELNDKEDALTVSINAFANIGAKLSKGKLRTSPELITRAIGNAKHIATVLSGIAIKTKPVEDSLSQAIDITAKLKLVDTNGDLEEAGKDALSSAIDVSGAVSSGLTELKSKDDALAESIKVFSNIGIKLSKGKLRASQESITNAIGSATAISKILQDIKTQSLSHTKSLSHAIDIITKLKIIDEQERVKKREQEKKEEALAAAASSLLTSAIKSSVLIADDIGDEYNINKLLRELKAYIGTGFKDEGGLNVELKNYKDKILKLYELAKSYGVAEKAKVASIDNESDGKTKYGDMKKQSHTNGEKYKDNRERLGKAKERERVYKIQEMLLYFVLNKIGKTNGKVKTELKDAVIILIRVLETISIKTISLCVATFKTLNDKIEAVKNEKIKVDNSIKEKLEENKFLSTLNDERKKYEKVKSYNLIPRKIEDTLATEKNKLDEELDALKTEVPNDPVKIQITEEMLKSVNDYIKGKDNLNTEKERLEAHSVKLNDLSTELKGKVNSLNEKIKKVIQEESLSTAISGSVLVANVLELNVERTNAKLRNVLGEKPTSEKGREEKRRKINEILVKLNLLLKEDLDRKIKEAKKKYDDAKRDREKIRVYGRKDHRYKENFNNEVFQGLSEESTSFIRDKINKIFEAIDKVSADDEMMILQKAEEDKKQAFKELDEKMKDKNFFGDLIGYNKEKTIARAKKMAKFIEKVRKYDDIATNYEKLKLVKEAMIELKKIEADIKRAGITSTNLATSTSLAISNAKKLDESNKKAKQDKIDADNILSANVGKFISLAINISKKLDESNKQSHALSHKEAKESVVKAEKALQDAIQDTIYVATSFQDTLLEIARRDIKKIDDEYNKALAEFYKRDLKGNKEEVQSKINAALQKAKDDSYKLYTLMNKSYSYTRFYHVYNNEYDLTKKQAISKKWEDEITATKEAEKNKNKYLFLKAPVYGTDSTPTKGALQPAWTNKMSAFSHLKTVPLTYKYWDKTFYKPFSGDELRSRELKREKIVAEYAKKASDLRKKADDAKKAYDNAVTKATESQGELTKKAQENIEKLEEKLEKANTRLEALEAEKEALETDTPPDTSADTLESVEDTYRKRKANDNKKAVETIRKTLLEIIVNKKLSTPASPASPASSASSASPTSPSLPQSVPLEDTKDILTKMANSLCELIDSKLSIYEYDIKKVTKSFSEAIISFEVAVELLKKVAYELNKSPSKTVGGAPGTANTAEGAEGANTAEGAEGATGTGNSVYSRIIAKLTKSGNDNKYKELIELMLTKRKENVYTQPSNTDIPRELKKNIEDLAKKVQKLADEAPELLKIILAYLKDTSSIKKQIDMRLNDVNIADKKRRKDETDKKKKDLEEAINEKDRIEGEKTNEKQKITTESPKEAEAPKEKKEMDKAEKEANDIEDKADAADVSFDIARLLRFTLDKEDERIVKESMSGGGGAGADPIDKYSDDSLKTQYIETQRYDKIDNNIINEFRKLKGEKDSGSGSKGLGRIKTDNKIEQLSNDIDVYNSSSFEDKEQNRQYITRRIDAFENDPENPIEELALTFDDRIVFIVATFFIRYITIIMIQWCIDINIIKTFYEGFIYYAVIYIIIFWFVVLFINIDNSYEVKYMNFNGVINSIRTLFYYFYMGTNGISRLLIHTSLIIILIVIPIILNIKKKQELTTDDSSPPNDNMKVLNYEERKQLTKALSLFTMFIWLFTSIIATKF